MAADTSIQLLASSTAGVTLEEATTNVARLSIDLTELTEGFKYGGISQELGKLPLLSTKQAFTKGNTDNSAINGYVDLLANGLYTAGTYTIAGGREFSDFELILVLGGNTSAGVTSVNSAGIANRAHIDTYPTSLQMTVSIGSSAQAIVTAESSTTFTVSRSSTGAITAVIGYLREGVS